ncbi:MAG: hypothetical protein ACKO04_07185 [Actinomycetes bacterium]
MTATRRRLHPRPTEPESPTVLDDQRVKSRPEVDGEPLEREGEVLRALVGEPVVELVSCTIRHGRVELRTQSAGSATLAEAGHLPPRTVLRAAAGACRSVVALHRAGWGHGNLRPDHVVVGGRGRATLCSLGRAQPLVAAPELVTVDRTATLVLLLEVADLLDTGAGNPTRAQAARAVRDAVGAGDADLLDVADDIERHLAPDPRPVRPVQRAATGVMLVLLAAVLAGAWTTGARRDDASGPSPLRRAATATTLRAPAGPLTAGVPDDRSVVVDLDCDGDDELVLLRPSTGELFIAPRLPHDDRDVRTVPAGRVVGAVGLTTSTSSDGCVQAVATMPDGSHLDVAIGAAPAAAPAADAPAGPGPTSRPARTSAGTDSSPPPVAAPGRPDTRRTDRSGRTNPRQPAPSAAPPATTPPATTPPATPPPATPSPAPEPPVPTEPPFEYPELGPTEVGP